MFILAKKKLFKRNRPEIGNVKKAWTKNQYYWGEKLICVMLTFLYFTNEMNSAPFHLANMKSSFYLRVYIIAVIQSCMKSLFCSSVGLKQTTTMISFLVFSLYNLVIYSIRLRIYITISWTDIEWISSSTTNYRDRVGNNKAKSYHFTSY